MEDLALLTVLTPVVLVWYLIRFVFSSVFIIHSFLPLGFWVTDTCVRGEFRPLGDPGSTGEPGHQRISVWKGALAVGPVLCRCLAGTWPARAASEGSWEDPLAGL